MTRRVPARPRPPEPGPAVATALRLIPAAPGVYLMRDPGRRVLYVGRSGSLRPRVRSYWKDLGGRGHLRSMLARVAELEPVLTESEHEAAFLERNLLEALRPPHNRTLGVESAIYLRLDIRAGSPGLELRHEPGPDAPGVRHFGPYLGWSPTALAVQALGRLHPLAYTAAGLAGSGRELGRGRGVSPGDREAIGERIAALLERRPPAVAGAGRRLAEIRDRLAGAEQFEAAAELQRQIDALGWLLQPQKALSMKEVDLDVLGRAGDIWAVMEVRRGRLSGVRTLADAALAEHLARGAARVVGPAGSPPPAVEPAGGLDRRWLETARRNAELRSRLVGAGALVTG